MRRQLQPGYRMNRLGYVVPVSFQPSARLEILELMGKCHSRNYKCWNCGHSWITFREQAQCKRCRKAERRT